MQPGISGYGACDPFMPGECRYRNLGGARYARQLRMMIFLGETFSSTTQEFTSACVRIVCDRVGIPGSGAAASSAAPSPSMQFPEWSRSASPYLSERLATAFHATGGSVFNSKEGAPEAAQDLLLKGGPMRGILSDVLSAIWRFFKIPPLQGQPEDVDDRGENTVSNEDPPTKEPQ